MRRRPRTGSGRSVPPTGRRPGPGSWPGGSRSSVAVSPANRAERGPGFPPRASTSIPESSAIDGSPSAAATAWALRSALLQVGVAGLLDIGPGTVVVVDRQPRRPASRRRSARSHAACGRCGWRSRRVGQRHPAGQAPSASCWIFVSSAIPEPARSSSASRSFRRERHALGGPLDLDEVAGPGHHDVEVDLGARVLVVAEVEPRLAVDDPDRDGRDAVAEDVVGDHARARRARGARSRARRSRR